MFYTSPFSFIVCSWFLRGVFWCLVLLISKNGVLCWLVSVVWISTAGGGVCSWSYPRGKTQSRRDIIGYGQPFLQAEWTGSRQTGCEPTQLPKHEPLSPEWRASMYFTSRQCYLSSFFPPPVPFKGPESSPILLCFFLRPQFLGKSLSTCFKK